jgi:hypothetical protein
MLAKQCFISAMLPEQREFAHCGRTASGTRPANIASSSAKRTPNTETKPNRLFSIKAILSSTVYLGTSEGIISLADSCLQIFPAPVKDGPITGKRHDSTSINVVSGDILAKAK